MSRVVGAVGLVAALALVVGSCGGGGGDDDADRKKGKATSSTTTTAATAAPEAALMDALCGGAPKVTDVGVIESPDITEASGLVASWNNTGDGANGVWWIHNDSGDAARLFAIDGAGKLLATVELTGAEARDWEDIAVGPPALPGGSPQLYVGDIGNNKAMLADPTARKSVRIYRLDEPVVPTTPPADGSAPPVLQASVTTFSLRYPEQPYDAEAMIVDPIVGDINIITKDWGRTGESLVFQMPKVATIADGTSIDMLPAGSVPLEAGALVTAGDVTRDGSLVALRTYGGVEVYRRPEGEQLAKAFETTPCEGPAPTEVQGESLGFAPDGGSYLTTSEGDHQVLHRTTP
ncbi:hypothetical protein [Dermatobacter hominis]|uniref:hypothetical protein n=1 Tax=Dermatobacter hominis TaxID=2884263 RepID=UPI001D12140F|nr:hypothetical protein [Dermatobacter hominis]UDY37949.1 hypothetical protein LH044_10480 [Dermatobacter hominis]